MDVYQTFGGFKTWKAQPELSEVEAHLVQSCACSVDAATTGAV